MNAAASRLSIATIAAVGPTLWLEAPAANGAEKPVDEVGSSGEASVALGASAPPVGAAGGSMPGLVVGT